MWRNKGQVKERKERSARGRERKEFGNKAIDHLLT